MIGAAHVPAAPTTPEEAAVFIEWCVTTLDGAFHPDTAPTAYVSTSSGHATFTLAAATRMGEGLTAAHDLLDDPYATTLYYLDRATR